MILLKKICPSHPELYHAYLDGSQIGILHLQHKVFTVLSTDGEGALVYRATTKGDGLFTYSELDYYL